MQRQVQKIFRYNNAPVDLGNGSKATYYIKVSIEVVDDETGDVTDTIPSGMQPITQTKEQMIASIQIRMEEDQLKINEINALT